ncbi:hypothetical protein ACWCQZ_19460 [Streptomyces sp. NPDC002285]
MAEINEAFTTAAEGPLTGVLRVSNAPIGAAPTGSSTSRLGRRRLNTAG